jgi:hypothetical protein
MDAMPTPSPPTSLYRTREVKEPDTAQPIADTENRIPASRRIIFRPNRSLNHPATDTPAMHPTRAELTYQPSRAAGKPNWVRTEARVPEMTAVSYPNRKPPNEAMTASQKMYILFNLYQI